MYSKLATRLASFKCLIVQYHDNEHYLSYRLKEAYQQPPNRNFIMSINPELYVERWSSSLSDLKPHRRLILEISEAYEQQMTLGKIE